MSASSEIIGTPAPRGFLPVPITLTTLFSAGTSEYPFMSRFISMILIASSRGSGLAKEDVDLALHEIVRDQLFAGELSRRGGAHPPHRCLGTGAPQSSCAAAAVAVGTGSGLNSGCAAGAAGGGGAGAVSALLLSRGGVAGAADGRGGLPWLKPELRAARHSAAMQKGRSTGFM